MGIYWKLWLLKSQSGNKIGIIERSDNKPITFHCWIIKIIFKSQIRNVTGNLLVTLPCNTNYIS